MAKIVQYPDPRLREKCQKVKRNDENLQDLISDLTTTLLDADNGIGLASTQIGEDLQVFAIHQPGHDHCHVYINPEIIDTFEKDKVYPKVYTEEGDQDNFYEGCLSIPGIYGTVKRWMEIQVKYQTLTQDGKLESKKDNLTGLNAIVFQHELDHLEGVLFIDHIKDEDGEIFKESEDGLQEIDIEEVITNNS